MRVIACCFVFAVAFLGLLGFNQPAKAWGKFGHLTVCDLAYRNLTPTSRAALADLLQSKQGGITVKGRGKLPDRHYTAFNVGCLEEDALPRRHEDDHFLNVSRDVTAISDGNCPGGRECILSGIDRDLAILKDTTRPREERVFALMAIGHWVGDIHQPLHISFADDRGGNGIDATLIGKCGGSSYPVENLHGVWDNCLLEAGLFERVRHRADYKRSWSRFTITYRAVDTLLANTSLSDEQTYVSGEPWQWAEESYSITLSPDTGYCIHVGVNCQYSETSLKKSSPKRMVALDQRYLTDHADIAEARIKKAGFRLAHLLNRALDPSYTGPVQNSTQPL